MQSHTRAHCLQFCLVSLGLYSHESATGYGEPLFLGFPPQIPSNPPTLQVRHLKTLRDLREVMQVVTRVLDLVKSDLICSRGLAALWPGWPQRYKGLQDHSGSRWLCWLHGGKQAPASGRGSQGVHASTVSRREGTLTLEVDWPL